MTDEQEIEILEQTIRVISETSKIVDQSTNLLKKKEKFIQLTSQMNLEVVELEYANDVLNFRILIGLLILDLSTTTRNLIRAEIKYEEIYSLKQMVVIIKEEYQKIYDFTFYNKNGDLITKNRNQSLWKKGIGKLLKTTKLT